MVRIGNACGGTLLKVNSSNESDIVLTAAHCVYGGRGEVKLGIHDVEQPEPDVEYVSVEKVSFPKDYIEYSLDDDVPHVNFNADIAILKLKKAVKFSDKIRPICLANSKPDDYSDCFVAGWGQDRNGYIPAKLQETHLPLLGDEHCVTNSTLNSLFLYKFLNIAKIICSGGTGLGYGCRGDSGSPLMCRTGNGPWVQHGVISAGNPDDCADRNSPAITVRLSYYNGWINEQIKLLSAVNEGGD